MRGARKPRLTSTDKFYREELKHVNRRYKQGLTWDNYTYTESAAFFERYRLLVSAKRRFSWYNYH